MKSKRQVAHWLTGAPGRAARVKVLREETLVQEFTAEELAAGGIMHAAELLLGAAQYDADERRTRAKYQFQLLDGEGGEVANMMSVHQPSVESVGAELATQGEETTVLAHLLRHKSEDQRQQHTATAAALKALQQANEHLSRSNDALAGTLISLIRDGAIERTTPRAEDDGETALKQSKAVALDKLADAAVEHLMPVAGEELREVLRTWKKRPPGRPPKKLSTGANGAPQPKQPPPLKKDQPS